MKAANSDRSGGWDAVFLGAPPSSDLWRRFCDHINLKFIEANMPSGGWKGPVLKTDVYEEAQGEGLLPFLAQSASRAIGIDVAGVPLRRLHDRGAPFCLVMADVRRMPFAARSLTAVVSTSTLDHFTSENDIVQALHEISRVLEEGGVLYLTLDNPVNPFLWLRAKLPLRFLRKTGIVPYDVGVTMPASRLRVLLGELGFDIVSVDHLMHFPRVLAVPLARLASGLPGVRCGELLLSFLRLFERLPGRGLRTLTGHYSALIAVRRHQV